MRYSSRIALIYTIPSILFSLRRLHAVMAVMLMLLSGGLQAAALGEATVHSSLGQKLDAEIEIAALTAIEADSLLARLAPGEAFAQANVDYTALVRSLRFSLEKKNDRYIVRVSSDQVVTEPFITLLFELNANGVRTIRQYALLIDPPIVDGKLVTNEPELAPQVAAASAVAPAPTSAVSPIPTLPAPTSPAPTSPTTAASAPSSSVPVEKTPTQATSISEAAAQATTHRVQRGETLAAIAASLPAEGVRLEQAMLALQNTNPEAFEAKNINRMKAGSLLQVPDADTMRAIDAGEARKMVLAQTNDFQRYRKTLAERAAKSGSADAEARSAADEAGNRSSSGQVGMQVRESKSASAAQDTLKLSSSGGNTASSAASAATASNPQEQLEKIAADKALADANQRIAALENNINQIQQTMAVKDQQLATVQQRAEQAKPAKPSEKPVPTVAVTETSLISTAISTARSLLREAGLRLQAFRDDPVALAIAVSSLLLPLLIFLGLRRRSKSRHRVEPELESQRSASDQAASVFGESGGRHVDTSNSVFHSNFVPSVSQFDTNEVDAVAEADVYIAYGRDEQAEEILLDALRQHPERHALRVKLLEIYATRKDKLKFGNLAAELRVMTHGVGAEWSQAAHLGQMLDPDNLLYGAALTRSEAPAVEAVSLNFKTSERADVSPVIDFELKLEGMLDERRKTREPEPKHGAAVLGKAELTALTNKLDLALACQEIGDHEGARELLTEVAAAGHPELAQRAQSLLSQLA